MKLSFLIHISDYIANRLFFIAFAAFLSINELSTKRSITVGYNRLKIKIAIR